MRDLRHSFATKELKNTGDLAAVSKTLGHASVDTTDRYIHTNFADVMKLAEAVAGTVG